MCSCRLCMGEAIEKIVDHRDSKNTIFGNINVEAALCFVEMADGYLAKI